MKKFFVAVALTVLTAPVWAASKTVTLSVPSMGCEVCPITMKKALIKVSGVSQADATFDAGYPSTPAMDKQ